MSNPSNQANLIQLLRRIPPKWALLIVGVVLVYWLGQPVFNRTFGWNLPTIAAMLGEGQPRSKSDSDDGRTLSPDSADGDERVDHAASAKRPTLDPSPPAPLPEDGERGADTKKEVFRTLDSKPSNTAKSSDKSKSTDATKPAITVKRNDSAKPGNTAVLKKQASKYSDFLTEVGPDRYRSPAGLFYTRGSEEGHRLKHIAKHLEDQPTRPGSHGVFDGDLNQVLRWIDEAYQKVKKGDRSERTFKEDESTKYEVTFDKPIGYVGGSDGKRKGNPPTKRLRLVVIGQNVITAFPF